MAFESIFKSRELVYEPRITKKGILYLRESEVKNIKKFSFVHIKIDRKKKLIGLIFSGNNPDKTFFKITHNGSNAIISLKAAFKELNIKLTRKFYVNEIKEENGMHIIDLKDAE